MSATPLFRGIKELQALWEKYNFGSTSRFLGYLTQGKVSPECSCPQCRTLALCFRLERGEPLTENDLADVAPSFRQAVIQFICLGGINGQW